MTTKLTSKQIQHIRRHGGRDRRAQRAGGVRRA